LALLSLAAELLGGLEVGLQAYATERAMKARRAAASAPMITLPP
jgi:hypothetical protein